MPDTIKVEQLSEQSTASGTFVDIPSTTLTFTPGGTGEVWMVFATGKIRSSSNNETSVEARLVINGTEHDLCGHQNNNTTAPNGAGFMMFDRITGVATLQTVKLQFRAAAGTSYADTLRVVVAKVPAGADFQYFESNGIVTETGVNLDVGSLVWTPTSTGDYVVIGKMSHHEAPGGSTSQAWLENPGTPTLHPDAPSGDHHSNARDPWNPMSVIFSVNLTAVSQTMRLRFTSSNGNQDSQHRYRKIMAFRRDAFDATYYNLTPGQTTTTSASFQTKNSVAVPAPPTQQEFLSFQSARISGTNTNGAARKSGELRRAGSALIQTNHRINRNGSDTQGYHHMVSCVDRRDESGAITFANGFLSPDGGTNECAESVILVLRYPAPAVGQTPNAPFYGMIA